MAATTVAGSWINGANTWYTQGYLTYEASTSATSVTIYCSSSFYWYCTAMQYARTLYNSSDITSSGYSSSGGTTHDYSGYMYTINGQSATAAYNVWFTYPRKETAYNVTITNTYYWNGQLAYSGTATATIQIPALDSKTITYNGNATGVTDIPSSQVKYYGKNINLRTGVPVRTGYKFEGWATSSSGAVAYSPGDPYSSNPSADVTLYAVWTAILYDIKFNANGGSSPPATLQKQKDIALPLTSAVPVFNGYKCIGWALSTADAALGPSGRAYTVNDAIPASTNPENGLTLYAIWELDYQEPILLNVRAERCTSSGSALDEGTYAIVRFDYRVYQSQATRYYGASSGTPYASNTATISASLNSTSNSKSVTSASASDSIIVGNNTLGTDNEYSGTITITDGQSNSNSYRIVVAMTRFPLDYSPDARAVGLLQPAPENVDRVCLGADTHVKGDICIVIDGAAASGDDYEIRTAITAFNNNNIWSGILT